MAEMRRHILFGGALWGASIGLELHMNIPRFFFIPLDRLLRSFLLTPFLALAVSNPAAADLLPEGSISLQNTLTNQSGTDAQTVTDRNLSGAYLLVNNSLGRVNGGLGPLSEYTFSAGRGKPDTMLEFYGYGATGSYSDSGTIEYSFELKASVAASTTLWLDGQTVAQTDIGLSLPYSLGIFTSATGAGNDILDDALNPGGTGELGGLYESEAEGTTSFSLPIPVNTNTVYSITLQGAVSESLVSNGSPIEYDISLDPQLGYTPAVLKAAPGAQLLFSPGFSSFVPFTEVPEPSTYGICGAVMVLGLAVAKKWPRSRAAVHLRGI
jgi:hypothetical protein